MTFVWDSRTNQVRWVNMTEYLEWFDDVRNRTVAWDEVDGRIVSTVCLPFALDGPMFETMVFGEEICKRYRTVEEAREGHRRTVEDLK